MIADLHVHSHYSDGSDSVQEVLLQAKQNNVSVISFVDHDTIASLSEAMRLGQKYGIKIIPGIEISAYDFTRKRKVHLLGYGYQPDAPHIQALCTPLLEKRHNHSLWQIEQIRQLGITIDKQEVIENAKPGGIVYKQHIMNYLTNDSYQSTNYQKLYRALFKGKGVAAKDIEYVDVFHAMEAIHRDEGKAILAHPGQLNSYSLLPELIEAGLDGIERNHFDHTPEDHQRIDEICKENNLFITGGSDFHGINGKQVTIGDYNCFVNDVKEHLDFVKRQ